MFFPKHQASHARVPVNTEHVGCLHLSGGHQVCQRENYLAFDGALQMASAVALIRAFV
jgi:hypothetical protein